MAFDDLIKGLAVFNQGVKELAISHATNDANQQLNDLNTQQLGREKQLQAQSAIGNSLALRLQSAGADGADIAATASRLSPSGGEMYQSQIAQEQQAQSEKFQLGLKREEMTNAKDIAQMKIDAMSGKGQGKAITGLVNQYSKDNKDDLKAIRDLNTAQTDLGNSLNKDGSLNPAGVNLVQMKFVKTAMGRANWQEIQMGNPSQSVKAQALRSLGIKFNNADISDNARFYSKLIDAEKADVTRRLGVAAKGVGAAAEDSLGLDADKVERAIVNTHLSKFGYTLGNAAAASAAPAPAAPKAPAAPMTSNALKYMSDN